MTIRIRPSRKDTLKTDGESTSDPIAVISDVVAPVRGSREPHFSAQQIIAALKSAAGVQAGAARLLGCSRQTVSNYCANDPEVAAALHELRETLVDRAEAVLLKHLSKGSLQAAALILRTQGRRRGWSERLEVEAPQRQPQLSNDWSKVPLEQLREIRKSLAAAGAYNHRASDDDPV